MMRRIFKSLGALAFFSLLALTAADSLHPLLGAAAVAIHEAAHLAAAKIVGVPIRRSVWRGGIGMQFDFSSSSYLAEAAVCLSGSISNYLSAVIVYAASESHITAEAPLFFICYSVVIGTVNLLPAASLDGGAVLRCILFMHMDQERACDICTAVSRITVICFWLAAAVLMLKYEGGISMMALALYLLISM
jgi:Zn-dependent protease